MAIIDCPNCGAEVSDKALFCGNCGAQIAGNLNKYNRNKKIGIWSAVISAVLIGSLFFIFQKTFQNDEIIDLISYELLNEWTPVQGGVGLDVLVSDNAPKDKVMELAKYLKSKNKKSSFIVINIFDSKEAWENQNNPDYPSEKYVKHHLVQATVDNKNLYDETNWRAVGREK